jgi:hypothetical protein
VLDIGGRLGLSLGLADALTETLGLRDKVCRRNNNLDLYAELANKLLPISDKRMHTLTGRPSIRRPFSLLKALLAPSAWWKVTWAIPRLTPPGPYEISTFLTFPMDCWKYS